MKFNIGDVVMLKSGGPSMTVTGYVELGTPDKHGMVALTGIVEAVYFEDLGNGYGDEVRTEFDERLLQLLQETDHAAVDEDE